MSRNGTGVFSIENPILVGALRSSAAVNENFTDEGDEITNTLPVDAQAGMDGPLKAHTGSITVPSITFGGDRNLGFYRKGSDSMSWAVLGEDAMWNDADRGMHFEGIVHVSAAVTVNSSISGSDVGAIENLSGTGLARRTGTNDWELDNGTITFPFVIDAGSDVIQTGVKGDLISPCACTLTGVRLFANTTGSCVINIWSDVYGNYPPSGSGDSITGSSPPTLSNASKSENLSLSGWQTSVAAGDILRFNVASVSTISRLKIELIAKRFI